MSIKESKRHHGAAHPSAPSFAAIKWNFVSDLGSKQPSRVQSYLTSPHKATNRSSVTALKPNNTLRLSSKLRRPRESLSQSKSSASISKPVAGKDIPQIDKQAVMWKLIQAELPALEEKHPVKEASVSTSFEDFPMTMDVIESKANRKQQLKSEKTPYTKQPSVRRSYHGAWYLPPKDWKLESTAATQWSYIQLAKGERYSVKKPYFFLHIKDKQGELTLADEFIENVKKFQRMPMMSKFKGYPINRHLEEGHSRIPPFLEYVKADKDQFRRSVDSLVLEKRELDAKETKT